MPTGYTAGILDGNVTTFPQFAKKCMRAFGATIHMRDDDMDAQYQEREPSDYYTKEISKAKKYLKDAQILSDEAILANKKNELEESKKYHIDKIKKAKIDTKKLNEILIEIKNWQPPTSEHQEIKDFMIDQIIQTIDFDCDTKYHDKKLAEIEVELFTLNAKSTRETMIAKAKKDLEYYTKEYNSELERCTKSNKWVSDFINSLK